MPASTTFAGGIAVLLVLVVTLAMLTERQLEPAPHGARLASGHAVSTRELYLNVLISQLLVVGTIVALAYVTGFPPANLGVSEVELGTGAAITTGVALGVLLYVFDEVSVGVLDRVGIAYSEDLRAALAPDTVGGWTMLLGVVLPVIAVAEELLFRAAIIGGFEGAFGLSAWHLVVLSSVVFAVGHGIQGPGGVIVTGVLGIVLASAFVLTGSLLLVIIAHYVVNALEFVVNEGFGITWTRKPAAG